MQEKLSIKKAFLHEKIFLFLYSLLKNIFIIGKDQKKSNLITNKLHIWINYINDNIIKTKDKYINKEYSIKNLRNIIMFTESQNLKYCGDIIEQILIIIFSKVFETGKDNTINKYIFNNLLLINERGNYEFFNWIKNESLCKDEFNNLEKLFDIDGTEDEVTKESLQRQKDSIFYNFLREILKKKYISTIYIYDKRKNKNMYYINNGDCFNYYMSLLIYNKTKKYISKKQNENRQNNINDEFVIPVLDKDILKNSIIRIMNNLKNNLSYENKPFNQLIRCFFTQVFIYYQNIYLLSK